MQNKKGFNHTFPKAAPPPHLDQKLLHSCSTGRCLPSSLNYGESTQVRDPRPARAHAGSTPVRQPPMAFCFYLKSTVCVSAPFRKGRRRTDGARRPTFSESRQGQAFVSKSQPRLGAPCTGRTQRGHTSGRSALAQGAPTVLRCSPPWVSAGHGPRRL